MISIKGRKPEVLAALYNASKPLGLGTLHYTPEAMTEQEAEELLNDYTYFDYLKGRVMKCDFKGDDLNPAMYDRDNGKGSAEAVINGIK
jgi:hypothetical protein